MEYTIEIDRPADDVFGFVTDPSRFPQWQKDVVRVAVPHPGTPGLGERFATSRRIAGAERSMTQEVTEFAPEARRWAVRGVDGPIRPHATVTVEPLDGGTRCRVLFALDFEAHGVGVPLAPVVRRQAEKSGPVSYTNLKNLLEAG